VEEAKAQKTPASSTASVFDQLVAEGDVLYAAKEFDQAIEKYNEALNVHPQAGTVMEKVSNARIQKRVAVAQASATDGADREDDIPARTAVYDPSKAYTEEELVELMAVAAEEDEMIEEARNYKAAVVYYVDDQEDEFQAKIGQYVTYRVQLAVSSRVQPADYFSQRYGVKEDVEAVKVDGKVKYLAGNFEHYDDATVFKDEMKEKGITGAFLVAIFEGKTITLAEAAKFERPK
jgi:tetratricopeptide (TPR) repeat protein